VTSDGDYHDPKLSPETRCELLLGEMTLAEKIGQMCQYVAAPEPMSSGNPDATTNEQLDFAGHAALIREGRVGSFLKVPGQQAANQLQELASRSRLGVPLLIATDAIHGHAMDLEAATVFPSPIGLAATFDAELVERVAVVTATEMRATGFHWTFSPNVDVTRDPRWGRTGETFGEDPLLAAELGAAMVQGYQGDDFSGPHQVLACAKHLVAGGVAENGLNGAPADISERTLREVLLPPFARAVAAGVGSVMPAHNEVNGVPCHGDANLLTTLLRDEWGFRGFVVSDWNDVARLHATHRVAETRLDADHLAVAAGIDVHMHGGEFFENVTRLVESGRLPLERIDAAARRILLAKFRLGLFERRYTDELAAKAIVGSAAHLELALEAARKSIVLLKNEGPLLPLRPGLKLLLTGPNADDQSLLGDWSRLQARSRVSTVLDGLRTLLPAEASLTYVPSGASAEIGARQIAEAVRRAREADAVIIVAGENSLRQNPDRTSGENVDRASLELPGRQLELVRALAATAVPVVLVLINGAPIASACFDEVDAIVEAWEPGLVGGTAIAEVLLGLQNPSGRLPISVPRSVGHVRSYYNHKPSSYHRSRFHGARAEPHFAFGHGLSYTTFAYRKLKVPERISAGEPLRVEVDVENRGSRRGDEIVLLFLQDLFATVTRPVRELKAFRRVSLLPGERRTVRFELPAATLSHLDQRLERVAEPGLFRLSIGNDAIAAHFRLL
jgi:beta-glucosidase